MRVAVVGSGISGIATAAVLKRCGHTPILFEKSAHPGGVWARSYPEVRLQNIASQYHLADFPWPFEPDLHPTAEQIRRYIEAAINHFALDVRLQHEVTALRNGAELWNIEIQSSHGLVRERFPRVIIASGQYGGAKTDLALEGRGDFEGEILSDADIRDLEIFSGKRVAVIGFGKTAIDLATLAAPRAREVHHVFRTARWLIPKRLLGLHYTRPLFPRIGTAMMPSWSHGIRPERVLHERTPRLVRSFWKLVALLFRLHRNAWGVFGGNGARRRLREVSPKHALVRDLRSALALAPDGYFRFVGAGRIDPHRSAVRALTKKGLALADGSEVACDLVVTALGSATPRFPFLDAPYRALLEAHDDGVQLYRHLLHPRLPGIAFAGFNHGFLHIPAVEVATLWLSALWRGDLELPPVEAMEASIEHTRQWKRDHIQFEPSRSCAVSTRFQQYLDLMLGDLGLSPYRKAPNVLAELFSRYGPRDYAGLVDEYERQRATRKPGHRLVIDSL